MARFLIRVELHSANELNYIQLHAAMAREGFSRVISSYNGTKYHLPTAEYTFDGSKILSNIYLSAERAAKSTGCNYWIIAAEYTQCQFLLPAVN